MDKHLQFSDLWAVILGGSSGFGFAAVEKLVKHGMNVAVLYRENASSEKILKERFAVMADEYSVTILPYNINALETTGRLQFIQEFAEHAKPGSVKLLLHSIARGNLKPLTIKNATVEDEAYNELSIDDIQMTSYAMSTSLLDWTRGLLKAKLFNADGRIIGLTSEGAHKYWGGYAAVSVAKSSLESLAKYMAVELAGQGLRTNLIQAGITNTPSLKKIPGSEELIGIARQRNPLGRITTPADVADVVYLLCTPEAAWINGALIHVDGGEHCK